MKAKSPQINIVLNPWAKLLHIYRKLEFLYKINGSLSDDNEPNE